MLHTGRMNKRFWKLSCAGIKWAFEVIDIAVLEYWGTRNVDNGCWSPRLLRLF